MDRLTQNFGFGIVPKQVMKDSDLSIASKALYSYLCVYAGNKDTAFPSISLITYELKISKDTFYKYMGELKAKQYIETFQQKSENGQFNHSIYKLLPCPKISCTETSYTEIPCTVNVDTKINSSKKNSIKKNNKEIVEKVNFAEFVNMTQIEFNKLLELYGTDKVKAMITTLDNYKGSNNKKYASDYRAILSWVADKITTTSKAPSRQKEFGKAYD